MTYHAQSFTGCAFFADCAVTVKPKISNINPTTVMIAGNSVQITINGSGFGASPTVNLPSGFTKTQETDNDTQIVVTLNIANTAVIGVNQITVAAGGQTSNSVNFTVDGPYYLVVTGDSYVPNADGHGDEVRTIDYQIKNFSGSNVTSSIPIGETNTSDTGWSCTNHSAPTIIYTQCGVGSRADGTFPDQWGLSSNVTLTPTGCGFSSDRGTWNWCDGTTFVHELTIITGYIHTNAVSEFGVASPPNSIAPGTAEPH
jgi:hypothetical protein